MQNNNYQSDDLPATRPPLTRFQRASIDGPYRRRQRLEPALSLLVAILLGLLALVFFGCSAESIVLRAARRDFPRCPAHYVGEWQGDAVVEVCDVHVRYVVGPLGASRK